MKSARVTPVLPTNISCRVTGDAANIDDNAQDDQSDTGDDFDDGKDELNCSGILSPDRDALIGAKEKLTLSVSSNSKYLNDDYSNQEDANKYGGTQGRIPVLDR